MSASRPRSKDRTQSPPEDDSPTSPVSPVSPLSSDSPTSTASPTEKTPKSPPITPDASAVPIPPKILSGWTHRGTPSPRRVATATRLGAIDENTPTVAPDIPQRAQHRPVRRVLNFGFTPTLHASRHPPAYTEYSDVKGPNGEYLSEVRRNRAQPRRGGWCRLIAFAAIPILIIIALAVGLGVGLTRPKSSSSGSGTSPSSNTTVQLHFPEGSYSYITFLSTVETSCTPNAATWRCYPYETYNQSTTGSQTIFNWVISASSDNTSYEIASSNNPFALTFAATPLTMVNANTDNEAYTFSTPMQKIVVPAVSLTSDGSTTQCYYNNTVFEATLYTKKAKTYPPGASSGSSNSSQMFGQWPYAVEAQEVIDAGSGVPDCYIVSNGVVGAKVDIGTLNSGSGQCSCQYMNFGT